MSKSVTFVPLFASSAAKFSAVGVAPRVGERCESADDVFTGSDAGLEALDDHRIEQRFFAVGVLPEAEFVTPDCRKISLGKPMA
jgi:hypothetical protein